MFITFEGIDGSGKSTQIGMLAQWLRGRGASVLTLREPGGTALSEAVRAVLLSTKHEIHPRAELLLFEAARAQLAETVIRPALERGIIVICDRFADSSTAYQGYGRGLRVSDVENCNNIAAGGIKPDITFFLDISVETAFERATGRNGETADRMELSGRDFFERVREGYIRVAEAEKERFRIISAHNTVDNVHAAICAEISELLPQYSAKA